MKENVGGILKEGLTKFGTKWLDMREKEEGVSANSGLLSLANQSTVKIVVPWSVVDEIDIQEEQAPGNATQVTGEKNQIRNSQQGYVSPGMGTI